MSVNLLLNVLAIADSYYDNNPTYASGRAVDGNPNTRWASKDDTTPWLRLDMRTQQTFNQVTVTEHDE